MGPMWRRWMLLLLAAATCAVPAEVQPGDRVRLIERDQRTTVYPALGDTRVHLWFVNGSEATVLQVHAATD